MNFICYYSGDKLSEGECQVVTPKALRGMGIAA